MAVKVVLRTVISTVVIVNKCHEPPSRVTGVHSGPEGLHRVFLEFKRVYRV